MLNLDKLEQEKRMAIAAAELRGNAFFKKIMEELNDRFESKLMATDITDTEKVQDIVRVKQILRGVEAVIQGFINDGVIADIQLEKVLERPKKFNRGH